MNSNLSKKFELIGLGFVYLILFFNAYFMGDSLVALISAFCGITYTILAGKGNPICYIIGLIGSGFYIYLSSMNHLWGNVLLYGFYFVPMQIIGFFKWNNNLKDNKYEIIKSKLNYKTFLKLFTITTTIAFLVILLLIYLNDKAPIFDGISTTFSVLGMYLTVKRVIEQWIIWGLVNLFSLIMWLIIILNGTKAYSTVIMWAVYLFLAIYFYIKWKHELGSIQY